MNTEEVVHKERLRRTQRKLRLAKEAVTYMEYSTCKSRENKGKGISFTPSVLPRFNKCTLLKLFYL